MGKVRGGGEGEKDSVFCATKEDVRQIHVSLLIQTEWKGKAKKYSHESVERRLFNDKTSSCDRFHHDLVQLDGLDKLLSDRRV